MNFINALSEASKILKKNGIKMSKLDSEILLSKAINFLTEGRTTVVIAHRLSTILNSDKIYVIENGLVKDSGSHDELINKSIIYKNFYEKQIKK